jgi:hypothetical protein
MKLQVFHEDKQGDIWFGVSHKQAVTMEVTSKLYHDKNGIMRYRENFSE